MAPTGIETVSSDVLVLGGGIGGLPAAIKAKENGADVLVVDKGGIGWAGQVPISGGRSMIILPEDDPDQWVKWAAENGEYLSDQEWAYRFASKVYECTMELVRWGMPFMEEGGKLKVMPRMKAYKAIQFPAARMMPKMYGYAKKMGVRMMNKVMIVDLLSRDKEVVAALGLGLVDRRFYLFKAKAFILANGSCRYKRQKGFNVCSGEGVVMAYRAGAKLRNAEFSNTYGYTSKGYEVNTRNPIYYFFFNARGENVFLKHFPELKEAMEMKRERQDFAKITEAIAREFYAGNGPIYLDLTKATQDEINFAQGKHLAKDGSVITDFWNTLARKGVDACKEKVEIIPMFVGGQGPVWIDGECRTSASRLWAVGDASALGCGWSGARSPGTVPAVGIPYAFTSGMIAGSSAGVKAKETAQPRIDMREVERRRDEILSPLKREKGIGHRDLFYEIHEGVVPLKYNFFRKRERLEEAIGKLKNVQEKLKEGIAKDFHGLAKLVEADGMATSGEITFRAALKREESRGTHKRDDFPERDDKSWLKWITLEQVDGKMRLSEEPVPLNRYKHRRT
jgi:succinate dehydrogenase / fumarate reductase, flavoprotein subunit